MTKRALSTKDPTTKRPVLKFRINTAAMVFSSNELLVEILRKVSACEQYRLFALINKNAAAIARDPRYLYSAMQKFASFCETDSGYCECDELSIMFSFCFNDDPPLTRRYMSFWKNRQRNGMDEKKYASGELIRLPWKDGKQDGKEQIYASNGGITHVRNWKSGLKHGSWRTHHRRTLRVENECHWCEGKKTGIEKSFTEFGTLLYECPWLGGRKHGTEKWFVVDDKDVITSTLERQLTWEHGGRTKNCKRE